MLGNTGPMKYRANARTWNRNDKSRSNRRSEFEMSPELTCGPRLKTQSNSDSEKKILGVMKGEYNSADFPTEYEAAKFYVIKSYSEDDVHKSIKHNVWSSTANGNKKLDAAFHDAEVKANETGVKCPIFLFFSVSFFLMNHQDTFFIISIILDCFIHLFMLTRNLRSLVLDFYTSSHTLICQLDICL